ncbi:nuclear transport factor 2 family protein [Aeromicrobium sp. Sec7.5]|uniref:nuclear transport factor 2 family protein n=1 Tax=Aeromicrobium sp. Sec7.5 TaxID=3121276 RepID=UPI002FE4D121
MTAPTTTLPTAVSDYFALSEGTDRAETIRVFVPDAHVTDDGHDYRGREKVLAWLNGPASEFETTSTRLSAESTGDVTTVTDRLTGNFPGGQVDLRFAFTLDGSGLIQRLSISV